MRTSNHLTRLLVAATASVVLLALLGSGTALAASVPRVTTLLKVVAPTIATTEPGGGATVLALTPTETFGGPTQLRVIGQQTLPDGTTSYHVLLNKRPNGSNGWVAADRVVPSTTPFAVVIDLSNRTVSVFKAGKPVRTIKAVVGAPGTPTPTGEFYLAEAVERSAREFTGTWILPFAYSNVLDQFEGGPGRVAIHGRGPSSVADAALGTAASHGCVRIDNGQVTWLATHLEPGTPIRVQK